MPSVGVETGTGYLWRGLIPSIYVEGGNLQGSIWGGVSCFWCKSRFLEFRSSSGMMSRGDSGVAVTSVDR